jgi:NADH dehydrogenase
LRRLGVDVRTSKAVTSCDAAGVDTAEGRIEAATVIWGAGVKASPAGEWLSAPLDQAQRIKVAPDLSLPGAPYIFAVGDTATVVSPRGTVVPGIAPAAKQMGQYVGRLIAARVRGLASPGPFAYRHYGDLATIGRKSAIVSIGKVRLTGFIAWLFWSVAHIYYLIGVRNRFIVALNWLWDYASFQRGARLIDSYAVGLPPSLPKAERVTH